MSKEYIQADRRQTEILARLVEIEKELKILQPVEEFKRGDVVYFWDNINDSIQLGFYDKISNKKNYKHSIFAGKIDMEDNFSQEWVNCSKTNPLLNTDESN